MNRSRLAALALAALLSPFCLAPLTPATLASGSHDPQETVTASSGGGTRDQRPATSDRVEGRASVQRLATSDRQGGGRTESQLREAARLRSLALAAMEDGNWGRAEDYLGRLAEILPENTLPPVNLAICYLRLNQPQAALAQIERARRLDPDNPNALYTLTRLLEHDPEKRHLWRDVIERFATAHPRDPRPFYLRAVVAAREGRPDEALEAFRQALRRAPENLVLMTELLVAAAEARQPEAVGDALDAIEDRLDGFEGDLAVFAREVRHLLQQEKAQALEPATQVLRNLLRPTDLYQIGLVPLTGGGGAGGPLFPQLDFDPPLPKSIQGGQDIELAFSGATEVGLERRPPSSATAIYRCAAEDELLRLTGGGAERLDLGTGQLQAESLELQPPPSGYAISYDIDQDGRCDLVAADPSFGVRLYRASADGGYETAAEITGTQQDQRFTGLFPLDLDHDGDLDLLVARRAAPDLYLQNNGDGRWTERAAALGLDGGATTTTDVAVADFDDDGDLDLLTLRADASPRLYLNRRAGPLEDASSRWGLDGVPPGFRAGRVADFDHDGQFDLILWGPAGGGLYFNRGHSFEATSLPSEVAAPWQAAAVGDFDNDGDQDVGVALTSERRLVLLRNRRTEVVAEETGVAASGILSLVAGDFDRDGDLDLVPQLADGSNRFWRNRGGNRNQWLRLRLRGKHDNNAKNNTQGLFTRIEVRVGDSYQAMVGNGGVNHIGLGAARQADVLRVVWTNGLAQTWPQVAANRTLVEEQVLKGSCPFLYTWNGEGFQFVTDLMWKSPLGMLLPDGSPATHHSARDYVLIPEGALQPTDGELWLQITEELWETAYVDRQDLIVVDHPATAELVVDERFLPPPYSDEAPLHWIDRLLRPTAARDHRGRDVLDRILRRDGVYVADLPLDRYQGLTRGHSLELTFPTAPTGQRLRLLLWGWIFPTDSSINFALAQDPSRTPYPPRLEVRDPDGSWRTLADSIGFPNGKRKAMVVDLAEPLPAGPVTLRLSTSLQIYWDAAALAVGEPDVTFATRHLQVKSAHLHYRGYSRLYRESANGPHLFDYDRVSVGPRFRDMTGAFTRFGPVAELLAAPDDRYIVMNAGDELTIRFDASGLPPLLPGWRRRYVLYSDGWVKDADIHTAYSQTVEPLPYHGMRAYPDRPQHRYPATPEHMEYFRTYQTRWVTDRPFREALKGSLESRVWSLKSPDLK